MATIHNKKDKYLTIALDSSYKQLGFMDAALLIKQKITFPVVCTAFMTRENKIILQKKQLPFQNKKEQWDIFTSIVIANHSKEGTAIKSIKQGLNIDVIDLKHIKEDVLTTPYNCLITLFYAKVPIQIYIDPLQNDSLLSLDNDELTGIIKAMPEKFSEFVHWAVDKNLIFKK